MAHPWRNLTPDRSREIARRRAEGASLASLRRDFGIGDAQLRRVLRFEERLQQRYPTPEERDRFDAEWEDRQRRHDEEYRDFLRYEAEFASLPKVPRYRLRGAARQKFARKDGPSRLYGGPTLAQAHSLTDADLLALPGLGRGALMQIRTWLAAHPPPPPLPLPWWVAEE